MDVTDDSSVDAAKGIIEATEGKLDVLINNAGEFCRTIHSTEFHF
jgi:NAD(P)-dependent dehydrogenase (short-subunit alcohol dehydrogenase family)